MLTRTEPGDAPEAAPRKLTRLLAKAWARRKRAQIVLVNKRNVDYGGMNPMNATSARPLAPS